MCVKTLNDIHFETEGVSAYQDKRMCYKLQMSCLSKHGLTSAY